MKRGQGYQAVILLVIVVMITGIFVAGCSKVATPTNVTPPVIQEAVVSNVRNTYVVQAVKNVGPAVVGITNKAYVRDNFDRKILVDRGVGSGVIFDGNGYIVTNNHVVEGAQEIVVSLTDGRTFPGKVIGTDPTTDLAVVKVDVVGLPVAVLGDSDSLLVGEPAIAIGNPLGLEFSGSVTVGVISALNRTIELGERKFKLIQTDAAINPGNSGGALVNAEGQVIGINSAKISAAGVEGIGFAIPSNSARPILKSLMEKGKVIRAYLGVGVLDSNSAARYGYDLQLEHGVYVARVEKNGAAALVNIQAGDVILKINGTDINSVADLRGALDSLPVGTKVAVVIMRNGKTFTVNPVVTEMPN